MWREGLLIAESKPRLEVESGAGLALRFIDHEVEARVLPGAETTPARLLDGILTTASKTAHARWVVATVLAFQQHKGKVMARPEATILADIKDAPHTRPEILEAVRRLLDTMATTGLAHLEFTHIFCG